jgi:hypothetical protein
MGFEGFWEFIDATPVVPSMQHHMVCGDGAASAAAFDFIPIFLRQVCGG